MGTPYNRTTCRFCLGSDLALVLDLGEVALAGAFLTPDQFENEQRYPLQLHFCRHCFLLQVLNVVPPDQLFSSYFYQSSAIGTLRDHFDRLAAEVAERWIRGPSALAVEIGSNDGVLLMPLAQRGVRVVGVEPARNLTEVARAKGLTIENTFFGASAGQDMRRKYGGASVILANNVFAHIDDMHNVLGGIVNLLNDDGVFITENHYIGSIVDEYQYDMIYHEHLSYYSLLALDRFLAQFGLEVVDVERIPIHAGSIRYYIRKRGNTPTKAVGVLREDEARKGYDQLSTFSSYAEAVLERKEKLIELLQSLTLLRKTVVGYGASGRANTIIQYCGIDSTMMQYMVDDAPSKQGFYTPGSHFLITSRDRISRDRPDYLLVFAWAFADEIKQRNSGYLIDGGKIVVPLPYPRVID